MKEIIEAKRPKLIINNDIDDSKIMFPEKLKRANEMLEKYPLPDDVRYTKSYSENDPKPTLETKEEDLWEKINSVIPISVQRRQRQLYVMFQNDMITPKEHEELVFLNGLIEEKEAERILLIEVLANLKGVTIQELTAQR